MGRLIDTDEYEKRIKPYDTEDVMDKALYNFAHNNLITTPTAQPERKNGQWEGTLLVKNSGRVKCSECYAIYDWDTQAQYFKYCPNCGADMRGAERREG